jgi:UDP:flavonoid glycosyltransferase YjiC (YdhE family)
VSVILRQVNSMLLRTPRRPYIALCLGLMAEGHTATIVTHEEYKGWVEGFGVGHRTAGGDPTALMRLSVEHSVSSIGYSCLHSVMTTMFS